MNVLAVVAGICALHKCTEHQLQASWHTSWPRLRRKRRRNPRYRSKRCPPPRGLRWVLAARRVRGRRTRQRRWFQPPPRRSSSGPPPPHDDLPVAPLSPASPAWWRGGAGGSAATARRRRQTQTSGQELVAALLRLLQHNLPPSPDQPPASPARARKRKRVRKGRPSGPTPHSSPSIPPNAPPLVAALAEAVRAATLAEASDHAVAQAILPLLQPFLPGRNAAPPTSSGARSAPSAPPTAAAPKTSLAPPVVASARLSSRLCPPASAAPAGTAAARQSHGSAPARDFGRKVRPDEWSAAPLLRTLGEIRKAVESGEELRANLLVLVSDHGALQEVSDLWSAFDLSTPCTVAFPARRDKPHRVVSVLWQRSASHAPARLEIHQVATKPGPVPREPVSTSISSASARSRVTVRVLAPFATGQSLSLNPLSLPLWSGFSGFCPGFCSLWRFLAAYGLPRPHYLGWVPPGAY